MTGSYRPEVQQPAGESQEGSAPAVQERAQETARQATSQVQEKAQQASGQAREKMREQVDQRSTQAGEQVRPMADALRKTGEQLRSEGNEQPAKAAEAVAERLERLASYLSSANADRVLNDVEEFGRKRPWAVAAGGAVVGFVASRLLKASSSRRYEQSQGGESWTTAEERGLATTTPSRASVAPEPTVTEPAVPVGGSPVRGTPPEAY